MADEKISDLASAGALDGTETPPIVQGVTTVKVTLSVIYAWILAQFVARLLPTGGTSAQSLQKTSATDYAVAWQDTPAAGATGQIQFRSSGGGLAAAANAVIDNDNLSLLSVASPVAPSSGRVALFGRALANRILPAFVGSSDPSSALQPFFGRTKIGYWSGLGNVAIAPSSFGIGGPTPIGTNGSRNVAATNILTSLRRAFNVSAGTAGASAGYRIAAAQLFRSTNAWGGVFLSARFGEDNIVANSRAFIGLHSSVAAIGNVNPSTLTNLIGVGFDSGQSTWRVMHNDGAGTATSVDLGAGFPCNTNDEAYDVIIFAPPGQSTVWVQMIRLSTDTSVTTEITTDLPALDLMLAFHLWVNNGSTAGAKGITISTMYADADY